MKKKPASMMSELRQRIAAVFGGGDSSYRSELLAKRKALQPAIDRLADLPALQEKAKVAREAEQAYRWRKDRPTIQSRDPRGQELSGIANRARAEADTVDCEGREAQERARDLDELLGCHENAERLKAQLSEFANAGREVEGKRNRALALRATLTAEADALDAAVSGRRNAHVENALEAQLAALEARAEGKPATTPTTTAPADAEDEARLKKLRDDIAGTDRLLAKYDARIAGIVEQAAEASGALRGAQALVARYEFNEIADAVAPILVELRATGGRLPEFRLDDLQVSRRSAELAAECAPWKPAPAVEPEAEAVAEPKAETEQERRDREIGAANAKAYAQAQARATTEARAADEARRGGNSIIPEFAELERERTGRAA